jgi:hypothetical protein
MTLSIAQRQNPAPPLQNKGDMLLKQIRLYSDLRRGANISSDSEEIESFASHSSRALLAAPVGLDALSFRRSSIGEGTVSPPARQRPRAGTSSTGDRDALALQQGGTPLSESSWSTAGETFADDEADDIEACNQADNPGGRIPDDRRLAPHLTDDMLAATVPQGNDHSIHPDDIPLAGYLLARQVDGRPVEGEYLALLRDAHDSVREARNLLPYGRGNVVEDARVTNALSVFAVDYSRDEFHHLPFAVGALLGGAGNCQEYATLTALAMAARLPQGAQARTVKRRLVDHTWTEASIDGNFKDRKHTVVADGWRQGPAVFAPDHAHAAFTPGLRRHIIDPRKPPQHLTAEKHGTLLESYKARAQKASISGVNVIFPSYEYAFDPDLYPLKLKSGVRTTFAKRAAAKLEREIRPGQAYARAYGSVWRKMQAKALDARNNIVNGAMRRSGESKEPIGIPSALRTEIQSIGIARQLAPAISQRELIAVAPRIAQAARTLALPTPSTAQHPFKMRAEIAQHGRPAAE